MKKLNKNGSVLTMAVMVTMIAMVLIGGMFMVASVYHSRSFQNNAHRQAYLYAKDTCQVFGMKIARHEDDYADYIPDNGSEKTYRNIRLESSAVTEAAQKKVADQAVIKREDKKITIRTTSNINHQKATVKLTLNATDTDDADAANWTWNIGVYS